MPPPDRDLSPDDRLPPGATPRGKGDKPSGGSEAAGRSARPPLPAQPSAPAAGASASVPPALPAGNSRSPQAPAGQRPAPAPLAEPVLDLDPLAAAAGPTAARPSAAPGGGGTRRGAVDHPANRPIPVQRSPDELPDADDEDDEAGESDDDFRELLRYAPAWLVSTVFHMLLLIVLGLLAVSGGDRRPQLQVEGGYADADEGLELDEPTVLEGNALELDDQSSEQVITATDLPAADDPLAAPLEIGELQLGPAPVVGPATIEGAPIGLALKGREAGSRNVLLQKYGGTQTTEAAVEMGLAWLAKQQRSNGSWSLVGPYRDGARTGENEVAATAMALLAFQGHGDTHRSGKYANKVDRGWRALRKMQRSDGLFSGAMASRNELLYAHAQATIALCELYAMTRDQTLRSDAERAIKYACQVQDKTLGGWRYIPGEDSDTSVTGWFVMALQSARMGGIEVPEETIERVVSYLDLASLDGGRRYGYWRDLQPSNAVTAEGLLCRQYLGWAQNDPRLVEGAAALNTAPIEYMDLDKPDRMRGEQDVYYWYYATQVTHHMEGEIWEKWNAVLREIVPANQVKSGPEAGSWTPALDKWGGAAGRLYTTCLSIYMLEVYYRHLPLYSGYRALAGGAPQPAPEASGAKQSPPTDKQPAADRDTATEETIEPDGGAPSPAGAPESTPAAPVAPDGAPDKG